MREEAGATTTATATATAADEHNWFARWEEELPSPEELMPLSQTLITPDLALAFDIPTPNNNNNNNNNSNSVSNHAPPPPSSSSLHHHHHHHHHHLPPPPLQSDFDSADLGSSGPGASPTNGVDEPARTLKRPRLVWTPQLHKRFVDAVAHLGIKNAVPKTIMQLMSVDGLTRENVASHLQKYRLYLKRMQGLSSSGGGGAGGGSAGPMSAADAATDQLDQLFASGPIPHHFLNRGGSGPRHGTESFVPFVPMAALQQHHQQMAAAAAAAAAQQQFYHQRQQQLGHFGSPTAAGNGSGVGGFDHGFLTRAMPQAGLHRMGPGGALHSVLQPVPHAPATAALYGDDLEERGGGGSRKVLTLFPTGED